MTFSNIKQTRVGLYEIWQIRNVKMQVVVLWFMPPRGLVATNVSEESTASIFRLKIEAMKHWIMQKCP